MFMSANQILWYAVSLPNNLIICCANCNNEFDLQNPFVDHHIGCCPICGIECTFLDWKDRKIQIVIQNAPPAVSKLIHWMQVHLDELEYVELLGCLEELSNGIAKY